MCWGFFDTKGFSMENDQFLNKAKDLAAGAAELTPKEMYVVWFCKTLQNWKALVSTDSLGGRYYEVTYNGDRKETYVDTYIKTNNQCITDSGEYK